MNYCLLNHLIQKITSFLISMFSSNKKKLRFLEKKKLQDISIQFVSTGLIIKDPRYKVKENTTIINTISSIRLH